MNNNDISMLQILDNNPLLKVDRAISEIRRGMPVLIESDECSRLSIASETLKVETLDFLTDECPKNTAPYLTITHNRSVNVGISSQEKRAVSIKITQNLNKEHIFEFIGLKKQSETKTISIDTKVFTNDISIDASIELCKISKLLPSSISTVIDKKRAEFWKINNKIMSITTKEIFDYNLNQALSLNIVSEAFVPLKSCENTKILVFRPVNGGLEHLAILINFENKEPVLTRIHSECYTGDLIGSLKCDCGDQLRGAISTIANSGGGLLIYLAQEGRGIGLVNKLRAYEMQGGGKDTVDANESLGFKDDERDYLPAIQILKKLNIKKVRLLTNNPNKVKSLNDHGIHVDERLTHSFPTNQHNWSYLDTKSKKLGHLL